MIRAFLHGLFDGWNACDTLAVIVIAAFLLSLLSCASTFKPSGVPGCARGHTWSDSAWHTTRGDTNDNRHDDAPDGRYTGDHLADHGGT